MGTLFVRPRPIRFLHLTDVQLGAVNGALAAVLGFIVRSQVTPVSDPRTKDGEEAILTPKPAP
jgi:hypothetical protein